MSRSKHRDSFGLSAKDAVKEAEQLFTKHPRFAAIYEGDRMEATVHPCGGQLMTGGRRTTRGCGGDDHLQPCPGGPLVYDIRRVGPVFTCIESRGNSWREAIDKVLERQAKDRAEIEERNKQRRKGVRK